MVNDGVGKGAVSGTVKAPMPCKVISMLKKTGDEVKSGEAVLTVESMKMETTITAPADGVVDVSVSVNEAVKEGQILCSIARQSTD